MKFHSRIIIIPEKGFAKFCVESSLFIFNLSRESQTRVSAFETYNSSQTEKIPLVVTSKIFRDY